MVYRVKKPKKPASDAKSEQKKDIDAEKAVLENLFQDYYKTRAKVYRVNFFRGVFFGFGSVLGGTLVVAIALYILGALADIPGVFGDLIQFIVETVQKSS